MNVIIKDIQNACPAIEFRIRRDVMGEKLSNDEIAAYYTKINQMPMVQQVLSWQRDDGFFGERMHTADSKTKVWSHEALLSFQFICNAKDYTEICIPYRGKHVFARNKFLPHIYLLRILANTFDWRTDDNIKMIRQAYAKLYDWLPLPNTYIKVKSQLVAPCRNIDKAYNEDCNAKICRDWLEFYELSARIGALTKTSRFYSHFRHFKNQLLMEHVEKALKNPRSFQYWSGYTGLALESKWNTDEKKRNDLLFRCALIETFVHGKKLTEYRRLR